MSELVFHPLAEKDFAKAYQWYAERSELAAVAFDDEVADALAKIAADPERHPRLDARHHFCLLQRFPYLIVYRRRENTAVVVAIAHGRRRVYWKRR
jgi:plasmid stabilization system protein ParE